MSNLCSKCQVEKSELSPINEMSINLILFLISSATIGLYSGVKEKTEFAWVYAILATLTMFYSFYRTLQLTKRMQDKQEGEFKK